MTERLVVIGGDAAGMSAASQARRRRPEMDILVLEKGEHTSYSACGIPYLVSGDVEELDQLVVRTPQEFRNRFRIDVRMRHEVMALDLERRELEVRAHAQDRTLRISFDQLLFATGSRPRRPSLPGIDDCAVYGVQTLDDGARLLEAAKSDGPQSVVVVGGGYIGLEMAEAFVKRGASVTVLERGKEVMRTLDADMGHLVQTALLRHGVNVRTGVAVAGFEPGRVYLGDGSFVPADLVVLGLGVVPNAEVALEAGVAAGAGGAIAVDRRQRTLRKGIWAAGDCAETMHLVSNRKVHIALGTVANKTGRVAGINIAGGYAAFPGVVGTAVSRLCATEVARTGLSEHEARAAGFEYDVATIESSNRAGYMPGAAAITVKMLAERSTGLVLGAQIIGEEGAAKRIDVVATALTARMTVADLVDLDLGYAPPFSPVWDPVQVAARQLLRSG